MLPPLLQFLLHSSVFKHWKQFQTGSLKIPLKTNTSKIITLCIRIVETATLSFKRVKTAQIIADDLAPTPLPKHFFSLISGMHTLQ